MTEDYADPELPPGDPPVVDLSPPAVAEVVELLTRILADARAGDVVAVAVATAHRDGAIGSGYAGEHQPLLASALDRCKHRINRDMDRMGEE